MLPHCLTLREVWVPAGLPWVGCLIYGEGLNFLVPMSKSLFYFHQWEISPGDLRGIHRTLVKQQWDSEGTWQDLPHPIQLSCWSLVSLRRQSNCLSWSLSCSQGEWHLPCYCSQLCGRSPLLLAFQTHLNQNKHGGCHLFLLKDHGLPMGLREDTFWKGLRMGFPGGSDGKKSACNVGNPSSVPGPRRSLGEGNDYPL